MTLAFELDSTSILLAAALSLGIGLIICFFGYRVFRLYIGLIGFVIGFTIGTSLAVDLEPVAQLLFGIGLGAVVGLATYALFVIGFVLAGALLGGSFAVAMLTLFSLQSEASTAIIVVAALIGAGVAFLLKDLIIMLATAFSGAGQIVIGGLMLLFPGDVTQNEVGLVTLAVSDGIALLGFFTLLVLTLAGFSTQNRSRRNR